MYIIFKNQLSQGLSLKPGEGINFKQELEAAIKNIGLEIPKILNSKDYEDRKHAIFNENKRLAEEILAELNGFAKEYNFVFRQTEKGLLPIPLVNNKPMTEEEMNNLSDEEIERLGNLSIELNQKFFEYKKRIAAVDKKLKMKSRS